jgi:hypothetical protein
LEQSPFPPILKREGTHINIKSRNDIKVYYYGRSQLAYEEEGRKYLFDGAVDGIPTVKRMSFSAIEAGNSKGLMFATGTLVFDPNEREELFAALGRTDWRETYWSEEDIDNLLLHPTVSELNRMLKIRDMLTIERIRGRMTYLKNTALQRPSEKVIELVNHRYEEVQKGIVRSSRSVTAADAGITKEMEDNSVLKAKNAQLQEELTKQKDDLQSQLAQLQAQIAQLLANQNKPVEEKKPVAPVEKKPTVRTKKTT